MRVGCLNGWPKTDSAVEERRCREAVAEAHSKELPRFDQLADEWRRALYLFIVASRGNNELGGAPLKDAAVAAAAHGSLTGMSDGEIPEADRGVTRQESPFRFADGLSRRIAPTAKHRIWGDFFTLPHLDELPLSEATRELAACRRRRRRYRWRAGSCCSNAAAAINSARAFYDPLLRDLLLIPP